MSQEELSSEEPACRPEGLRYFLSLFLAAARHSSASDSFMASRNVPRTSDSVSLTLYTYSTNQTGSFL